MTDPRLDLILDRIRRIGFKPIIGAVSNKRRSERTREVTLTLTQYVVDDDAEADRLQAALDEALTNTSEAGEQDG